MSPFFPTFDELPQTVPVFPLTGALLLPTGQLPLNIFEPRYIAMVDDALASNRLIAMVEPREAGHAGPTVHTIACAGRITALEETEDGRYLITLHGICRLTLGLELPTTRGYRRFQAEWSGFAGDLREPGPIEIDRKRLARALERYFRHHGISANWEAIENTASNRLITSLAMICPFSALEKQALLEAPGLQERADMVLSLIEMACWSRQDDGGSGSRH
ncbi:MAG: LON peptidase substrate-binding domain-containing protein [Azospirillaceae bacterium]